ncbi:MAG: hypothetical protein LBV71_01600 [Prevotella sp.]|jgi:sedoheptulokinase|nr:hypothetical protein [Prevotella sp.]
MYFIGIDIGTSSICGIIYNFENKEIESITRENNASIEALHIWEKAQDVSIIHQVVLNIINEFSIRYSDIRGIGFSGQMHGMLYVNVEGNAVSPLYTWQDERANQTYKENKTYAEYLSDATGYSLATGYGLVTHFYNIENNIVPERASRLCTIMDYIVMKLCKNTQPLVDYSNAASLGFFDIENLKFDTDALDKIGIDTSVLPETVESPQLVGHYKEIPVYSAIGDNQASFLGSVQNIDNSTHIMVGTSSQISVYSPHYVHIKSLDTRPFPGGGFLLVGAALCGGQSIDILKKLFENTLKLFSIGNNDIDYYEKMSTLDYKKCSNNLPVVRTLFAGTRSEPENRGSILNISTSNLTPENLILAFTKGVCDELLEFYKIIPEHITKEKVILIGSGNGIKKNALLRKVIEDGFKQKLILSPYQEESAFGACKCTIVGGNYVKGYKDFG